MTACSKVFPALVLFLFMGCLEAREKISALIVDGQNNHDWMVTTDAIRATLGATGRFEVSVATAPELTLSKSPRAPRSDDPKVKARFEAYQDSYRELTTPIKKGFEKKWQEWEIDFGAYDVVVLNYNGREWSDAMKSGFVDYVKDGGGVLLVHAANNAFRNWTEFNDIIGMGWRPDGMGKAVKIDGKTGKSYVDQDAVGSGHGSKHAFRVTVREQGHPVMKGLPKVWMHGHDELYHHMRGPAEKMTILSSAFSDPKQGGTGKHEPITWEVEYGKGKSIVTTMGHFGRSKRPGMGCIVWDSKPLWREVVSIWRLGR